MPVWTPGSYLIREYARHVQDMAVKGASGNALPWQKINKNTWQVDVKGEKEIAASYRVYANELTVRTNELNDDHGFWNNAGTAFVSKGRAENAIDGYGKSVRKMEDRDRTSARCRAAEYVSGRKTSTSFTIRRSK